MGYIKAEGILPIEIKELIQQYVDGKSIYIPSKSSHRQAWGTGTRMKQELLRRDRQIYGDYLAGSRMEELAGKCSILAEVWKNEERFLKENHGGIYSYMILSETLWKHLAEIDEDRFFFINRISYSKR